MCVQLMTPTCAIQQRRTGQAERARGTGGCWGESREVDTHQGWVSVGVLSIIIPNFPRQNKENSETAAVGVDARQSLGRRRANLTPV